MYKHSRTYGTVLKLELDQGKFVVVQQEQTVQCPVVNVKPRRFVNEIQNSYLGSI